MAWEEIVIWALFTLWALVIIFALIMTEVNVLKVFRNMKRLFIFRPSPLQREIMQEEKEIKELERQKADMERLDQLREKKERLFEEVSSEEGKPYKLIYNGTEINRRFKTEEEAFNYAEACSDNGLFSAQVERTD